jgi:hypothetical protein
MPDDARLEVKAKVDAELAKIDAEEKEAATVAARAPIVGELYRQHNQSSSIRGNICPHEGKHLPS